MSRSPSFRLVVPALLALSLRAHAGETLESRLTPLIDAHKGHVTLAVKHLNTGESFVVRGDEAMPTASLIKFPVMVEVYRQAAEGRIDLKAPVTLTKADKVPGSGVLTDHFSDGATFPLRDAVRLMIAFSDNTATNLVLDRVGITSTAETMEKMGCPNTKIHSKVYRRDTSKFPERSKRFGLGSTTANEMVRLLELLDRRELVSREASEAMLDHLRACQDREKFPRFLPPGTRIAFKTGSVDEVRTAAGIIETGSGPVALCVLTSRNEDHRYVADNAGNRLCAEVARAVFDHFQSPAAAGAPPPRRREALIMGFLDALRNLTAPIEGRDPDPRRLFDASDADEGGTAHPEFPGPVPAADPEAMALPPATTPYDREQWRRKLKRILEHLPRSEPEWDDLQQGADALDFGPDWVAATYRDEFALLVRKVVSDRAVTPEEHRTLDLARSLMGIPDGEAESMLRAIAADAAEFFGKPVEGVS